MHASLPMYMRPELADDHHVYWSLIREQLALSGIESNRELEAPSDLKAFWLDKNLLLSQTCGMPYRNSLHEKVQLVGTPDYQLNGCEPGYYKSAIVVRKEDSNTPLAAFKDRVFAYNSDDSQSGYCAPYWHFHAAGFWFDKTAESGGHQLSAKAVAEGKADIAAIDGVTWRLLRKYDAFSHNLHVLDWTDPTPGLPYVTSLNNDAQAIACAVNKAIDNLPTPVRERLGIYSLVQFKAEDYLAIENPDI